LVPPRGRTRDGGCVLGQAPCISGHQSGPWRWGSLHDQVARAHIMELSGRIASGRWMTIIGIGLVLAVVLVFSGPGGVQVAFAQEGGDAGGEAKTNIFWHIVKSAGVVFGPLLLLVSIGLVALIVLLAMDLRMTIAIPPGFVEDFTDTVNKRR